MAVPSQDHNQPIPLIVRSHATYVAFSDQQQRNPSASDAAHTASATEPTLIGVPPQRSSWYTNFYKKRRVDRNVRYDDKTADALKVGLGLTHAQHQPIIEMAALLLEDVEKKHMGRKEGKALARDLAQKLWSDPVFAPVSSQEFSASYEDATKFFNESAENYIKVANGAKPDQRPKSKSPADETKSTAASRKGTRVTSVANPEIAPMKDLHHPTIQTSQDAHQNESTHTYPLSDAHQVSQPSSPSLPVHKSPSVRSDPLRQSPEADDASMREESISNEDVQSTAYQDDTGQDRINRNLGFIDTRANVLHLRSQTIEGRWTYADLRVVFPNLVLPDAAEHSKGDGANEADALTPSLSAIDFQTVCKLWNDYLRSRRTPNLTRNDWCFAHYSNNHSFDVYNDISLRTAVLNWLDMHKGKEIEPFILFANDECIEAATGQEENVDDAE